MVTRVLTPRLWLERVSGVPPGLPGRGLANPVLLLALWAIKLCLNPVGGPQVLLSGRGHPGCLISGGASALGMCELIHGALSVTHPGAVCDSGFLWLPL